MIVMVVLHLLGMNDWVPKFVKKYADLRTTIIDAYNTYCEESSARTFPAEAYQYNAKIEGIENLK